MYAIRRTADCQFIPKTLLLLTGRESRPFGNRFKRLVVFIRNPKKSIYSTKADTIKNPFDVLVIELIKRLLGTTVTSWKTAVSIGIVLALQSQLSNS